MTWRRTDFAEVAERGHDAAAEVFLPDPVDHDAGGERVVVSRKPFGEREATPSFLRARPRGLDIKWRLAIRQHARHSRPDEPTWLHRIAAAVDVRGRRLASIPQCLNL